ncbi:MAG: hypothetical protein Q4B78_04140, partial [Bacillota bacterium]|nr:hypothetical protein [Bacillota bacterium]
SVEAEGITFMGDGNYIVAKTEIMTLPYGKYTVTEKNTSRFVQEDKKEMWNDNVRIYIFENKKDKWNYCSDNDLVINSLVNKK